jgi:S-adenosylmethionine:tRNA ribosyltransferase-isomerase
MAFEKFKKFALDALIAKTPAQPRDSSRLMILNRKTRTIEHKIFQDLPQYLKKGDALVINDSKVFPAKLSAAKNTGGKSEVLLVRQLDNPKRWTALIREYKTGMELNFNGGVKAVVAGNTPDSEAILEFNTDDILSHARKYGQTPLPHYIEKARKRAGMPKEISSDKERYQTVYAQTEGSIAAPTAGFHFTKELLARLRAQGVKIEYITLHVGWGTFKPLRGEPQKHKMLAELAEIPEKTAATINEVKAGGGRLFSLGTTSTRTLESFAGETGQISAGKKYTDLFIYPGYKFKTLDALITNFHFPNSTPLCLASAFAGENFMYDAYLQAVENGYRFYSFGDSMLIL